MTLLNDSLRKCPTNRPEIVAMVCGDSLCGASYINGQPHIYLYRYIHIIVCMTGGCFASRSISNLLPADEKIVPSNWRNVDGKGGFADVKYFHFFELWLWLLLLLSANMHDNPAIKLCQHLANEGHVKYNVFHRPNNKYCTKSQENCSKRYHAVMSDIERLELQPCFSFEKV